MQNVPVGNRFQHPNWRRDERQLLHTKAEASDQRRTRSASRTSTRKAHQSPAGSHENSVVQATPMTPFAPSNRTRLTSAVPLQINRAVMVKHYYRRLLPPLMYLQIAARVVMGDLATAWQLRRLHDLVGSWSPVHWASSAGDDDRASHHGSRRRQSWHQRTEPRRVTITEAAPLAFFDNANNPTHVRYQSNGF